MISRDPVRRRRWLNESEAGRRQMLADYRRQLQSVTVDEDISTIPIHFEIERTTYTSNTGEVSVLQKFRDERFSQVTEVKRFIYNLVQKDGIWLVVNYSVTNLGTE
jgi:hypothetical protein